MGHEEAEVKPIPGNDGFVTRGQFVEHLRDGTLLGNMVYDNLLFDEKKICIWAKDGIISENWNKHVGQEQKLLFKNTFIKHCAICFKLKRIGFKNKNLHIKMV